MFCPNCGTQVADGAAFCSACGNSVAPSTVAIDMQRQQFQMQKSAIRQSEIDELGNVMQHFSKKADVFQEYDLVCDLLNDFAGGAKKSLLVWGCIILSFGLIGMLGVISEGDIGSVIGMMFLTILPGILMLIGGIRMQAYNKKQFAYFQGEYARLSQELYDHYMSYPNCPIGAEYSNPEILSIIMDILQSGRADTIKESINLLISDINQSEVNEYLEMIEQNTAAINAQTRAAAFFAAASFFKD